MREKHFDHHRGNLALVLRMAKFAVHLLVEAMRAENVTYSGASERDPHLGPDERHAEQHCKGGKNPVFNGIRARPANLALHASGSSYLAASAAEEWSHLQAVAFTASSAKSSFVALVALETCELWEHFVFGLKGVHRARGRAVNVVGLRLFGVAVERRCRQPGSVLGALVGRAGRGTPHKWPRLIGSGHARQTTVQAAQLLSEARRAVRL